MYIPVPFKPPNTFFGAKIRQRRWHLKRNNAD
jgi:hypothetical protein